MSAGSQNIPLIRLETRLDAFRKAFKVNTTSNISTFGAGVQSLNIAPSGDIGLNIATPNAGYILTIKNNEQIGWQNVRGMISRTTAVDAGSRILKGTDNNLYIDSLDGNTIFRRGGVGASLSNTIFVANNTGFIGFNNSNPEAVVHIGAGNLLLENNRQISFKNSSGTTRGILKVDTTGLTSITSPVSLSMNVGSDSTEVQGMLISSDGRINAVGDLYTSKMFFNVMSAPTLVTATATITAAQILSRVLVTQTSTGITLTFPTGSNIDAELPSNSPVGTSFQFTIVNAGNSTGAVTLGAAPAGLTFYIAVTTSTIAINTSRTYLFRKTATNTFDVFTLSMS